MICLEHDWYFGGVPCPQCAAALKAALTVETPRRPSAPEPPTPKNEFKPKIAAAVTPPVKSPEPPRPKIDFAADWGKEGVASESEIAAILALNEDPEDPDSLKIPSYLRRAEDNTLMDPRPWGPFSPLKDFTRPATMSRSGEVNIRRWSDADLEHALNSLDFSIEAKQPLYKELTRRRELKHRLDKRSAEKEKDAPQS